MAYFIEDSFEASIQNGWDTLSQYLSNIEEYINKTTKEYEIRVREVTGKLTPERLREYTIDHVDEQVFYKDEFPFIIRNAYLVSACSLFETDTKIMCKKLKDAKNLTKDLSDLEGNLLERIQKYFKLAGIDVNYGVDWKVIPNYIKVRNCIVHNNGVINSDKKCPVVFIKQEGLVKEREIQSGDEADSEIGLTAAFCQEVTRTMAKFLNIACKDSTKGKIVIARFS